MNFCNTLCDCWYSAPDSEKPSFLEMRNVVGCKETHKICRNKSKKIFPRFKRRTATTTKKKEKVAVKCQKVFHLDFPVWYSLNGYIFVFWAHSSGIHTHTKKDERERRQCQKTDLFPLMFYFLRKFAKWAHISMESFTKKKMTFLPFFFLPFHSYLCIHVLKLSAAMP